MKRPRTEAKPFAPFAMRGSIKSTRPFHAATCIGVTPSESLAKATAPQFKRYSTALRDPFAWIKRWSGVAP